MQEHHDLAALVRAGTPLIVIETQEEERVSELFRHVLTLVFRPLFRWSVTDGLVRKDVEMPPAANPRTELQQALQAIRDTRERGIYLMLDIHPFLNQAVVVRLLREIALRRNSAPHVLVLISPRIELPEDLKRLARGFELSLPGEEALQKVVREEAFAWSRENGGRRVEIDARALEQLVRNLRGLSLHDARVIARDLIAGDGAITAADLPRVAKAKFELLQGDSVLSLELDTARFGDVAGLARYKRWLAQRRGVFLDGPGGSPLDPPKGVLLLGVQGGGKSLAAKATAGALGVPLLRMDFGALYNKYHGETERNLREALRTAETMEPCVLWIDEIEKGISTGSSDQGTSKRVLGTLLTWMAERRQRVFLVATANDITTLPPELVRKGRFDEVFFVDLPVADTRAEIARIHLRRRQLDPETFDLAAIAGATEGFSGAEIEQCIVGALYSAHADGIPLQQRHVMDEVSVTRPLSRMMAENVQALRDWARERTVPAD